MLCRNREVFAYWKRLGLVYMFIGLEAIDEETLGRIANAPDRPPTIALWKLHARLQIPVAINLIVEPDWDERRFEVVREWALSVPEMVHLTVATPYPGTETWLSAANQLTTLDYRLFDIQHAVMPTRLPLKKFYAELVKTQRVLGSNHIAWGAVRGAAAIAFKLLLRGQTNFIKMMWKFNQVYNAERQYSEHFRRVKYRMTPPPSGGCTRAGAAGLYVHQPHEATIDADAGGPAGAHAAS